MDLLGTNYKECVNEDETDTIFVDFMAENEATTNVY